MGTEAEMWLKKTYPEVYMDWLSAYLSPSARGRGRNKEKESVPECRVCFIRPNTGLHYGVYTCEADKQFLKRTFHERQTYKYCGLQCPPRFRGWCQYCRLRSSLNTGINLKMIRIGNQENKSPRARKPKKDCKTKCEPTKVKEEVVEAKVEVDQQTYEPNLNPGLGSVPYMTPGLSYVPYFNSGLGSVPSPGIGSVQYMSPGLGLYPHGLYQLDHMDQLGCLQYQREQSQHWQPMQSDSTLPRPTPLTPSVAYPKPFYQPTTFTNTYWPHHYPINLGSWNYRDEESICSAQSPPPAFPQQFIDDRPRSPNQVVPLDLSSSSSSSSQPPSRPSSAASCSLPPSRPSSAASCFSNSSSGRGSDIGHSFNKLSVNSALLQEALSMVGNISPGRMNNISNVSEVLQE